jgi:hypothetical protein
MGRGSAVGSDCGTGVYDQGDGSELTMKMKPKKLTVVVDYKAAPRREFLEEARYCELKRSFHELTRS